MTWQMQCLKQGRSIMTTKFKDGYEYADRQLRLGVTEEELETQAENHLGFDEFDKGMFARLAECDDE